ncbi:MAG: phosphonate ABC transporter substrate-binding protein [Fimbriimonas sp.]
MLRSLVPLLALLSAFWIAGCGSPAEPEKTDAAKTTETQTKLTVAIVPSEDIEKMIEGFEPIRKHLAAKTGLEVEVLTLTDYAAVVESLRNDKVDIAWVGPLAFVLAQQEAGAIPFAIGQKEGGSATYKSLILARADLNAKTLADLKGKTIALVDPASTSGNLMPRSMLLDATGKTAEEFFSKVVYAGTHDSSLLSLANGSVDACAVQDITYEKLVKSGQVDPKKVSIIATSDPIPQSPLIYRKGLSDELKKKVTDAILGAHTEGVTLDVPGMGAFEKFVPVTAESYEPIVSLTKKLKLSREQLSK